ncbi:MAG: hypothetical protein PVJ52_02510 [Candidatus Woesebacteria bacterium]
MDDNNKTDQQTNPATGKPINVPPGYSPQTKDSTQGQQAGGVSGSQTGQAQGAQTTPGKQQGQQLQQQPGNMSSQQLNPQPQQQTPSEPQVQPQPQPGSQTRMQSGQTPQQPTSTAQPQQSQQPTTPIESTSKAVVTTPSGDDSKKRTILLVAIGILLIALLGGVGYYFYSQTSETQEPTPQPLTTLPSPPATTAPTKQPESRFETSTQWAEYVSEDSTYSFSYPDDMDLTQQGESVNLGMWGPTQQEGTELYDGISLNFTSGPLVGLSLMELVDTKVAEATESGVSELVEPVGQETFDSLSGYTFVIRGLGEYRYHYLTNTDKEVYIEISVLTVDPGNLGFQETVDRILASVEIIQDQPSASPSVTPAN